jgi:hypothetical protein
MHLSFGPCFQTFRMTRLRACDAVGMVRTLKFTECGSITSQVRNLRSTVRKEIAQSPVTGQRPMFPEFGSPKLLSIPVPVG